MWKSFRRVQLINLSSRYRTMTSGATGCPATADIMDSYEGTVQVSPNTFRDYGGVKRFCGKVETIKCFENNPLVRKRLTTEDGSGRVLVVDGGGSIQRALMGDQLAAGAYKNGWEGVIINGAIRDSAEVGKIAIGCKALCTNPLKSEKRHPGKEILGDFHLPKYPNITHQVNISRSWLVPREYNVQCLLPAHAERVNFKHATVCQISYQTDILEGLWGVG
ncbi:unnamed protein product [Discosporangium mesarthrocarpum]